MTELTPKPLRRRRTTSRRRACDRDLFPRRPRGVHPRRGGGLAVAVRWRCAAHRVARRRHSSSAATVRASSPAATTARWSRSTPRGQRDDLRRSQERWIDHVALGPDGAAAWSAGKLARSSHPQGRERSRSNWLRRAAGSPLRPRAFAWRSRITTAHRSGFRMPRPSLKCSNGRARISASPSARTAASSSPPCRSRCCTAGGWSMANICECRVIPRACARSTGPRTAVPRDRRLRPTHSVAVRQQGRPDGQAADLARAACRRLDVVACHPKQPVVAAGYEDGMVLLVRLDDGAEILAKKPGGGAVSALPGTPPAPCWLRDGGRRGGDRGFGVTARAIETP